MVDGLTAYNAPFVGQAAVRPLGVFVRDAAGVPVPGSPAIPTAPGCSSSICGWARPCAAKAQAAACCTRPRRRPAGRGCTRAFVDTFAFQAPGFYRKQGYQTAFTLEEHPATGTHFYLTKAL